MSNLDELMEADAAEAPVISDESLEGIARLANQQVGLEKEVADIKELLDKRVKALRELSETTLPEAMQAIGLSTFTTTDGYGISIEDKVYATISQKNKDAAHTWLRNNGFADIIKNEVITSFGRNEDEAAKVLVDTLINMGATFKRKEAVHTGTLRAFIKEQLEQGSSLPLKLFSAFVYQKATIAKPARNLGEENEF